MIIKLDPQYTPIPFKDVPNGGIFTFSGKLDAVYLKVWPIHTSIQGDIVNCVNVQTGKNGITTDNHEVIYHSAATLNLYG